MTLETLQTAMIKAMKDKNKLRKDTLSTLVSAVKKTAIDKKCKDNITEDLVNEVILKEKKVVKEMIDTCPASRKDLLNEYEYKYAIICEFAPQIIADPKEIKAIIESLNLEITKANRGIFMKALKGKVDMKIANLVLEEMLKG